MRINSLFIGVFLLIFLGLDAKRGRLLAFQNPGESNDLINKTAPDFNLEDINGETVHLGSLRGKVVILDFWATWCTPCIKSFPAMEMAMVQYKDDKDVVFLFVNTWERAKDPRTLVKDFFEKRKFDFYVLLDLKDPERNTNKVAEDYKLNGIPAKFIIDREGIVRYHGTGFTGDDQKVVEELSKMIEFAREF